MDAQKAFEIIQYYSFMIKILSKLQRTEFLEFYKAFLHKTCMFIAFLFITIKTQAAKMPLIAKLINKYGSSISWENYTRIKKCELQKATKTWINFGCI